MKSADDTPLRDLCPQHGPSVEQDYAEDWLLRRELEVSERRLWNRIRRQIFLSSAVRIAGLAIGTITLLAILADQ